MNNKKQQNVIAKNLNQSLSLLIILMWTLFVVTYAIKFSTLIGEPLRVDHNLAWGYLAAGVAPVIVGIFAVYGRVKSGFQDAVLRTAFCLGIYYWIQSLFAIILPNLVDVQASFVYYIAPYVVAAVAALVVYVLLKGRVSASLWFVPSFLILTTIALAAAFIASVL